MSAHAFSSSLAGQLLPTPNLCNDWPQQTRLLPALTATSYGSNIGGSAGRVGRKRVSLQQLIPTLTASGAERGGRGDLLAVMRGRPMKHHDVRLLPTLTTNPHHSSGNHGGERKSLATTVRRLPTLTVRGNHNRAGLSAKSGDGLATRIGSGPLNPTWCEWLLGLPDGWTESEPSETASCRNARKSSGM